MASTSLELWDSADMLNFLLQLADPWAYFLIGALAAAEASAFVGLFIPGEAAMLLGGVLVYQGRASLGPMILAACLGAVIGDSIGYEIGRHFGSRLRTGRLGRRIGEKRWDRAHDYVRERGGRAVFFGRFVGVLRALVPAIAGSAGIPYGRFFVFNAAGGIIWATSFVLLGYAAGSSYRIVEQWAGRATAVLAGLVVFALAISFAAHWVRAHEDKIKSAWRRFLAHPRIARLRARYRPQLDFIEARIDPNRRAGLYLTVGLIVALGTAWGFGAIVQDVLGKDELALIDRPVVRFMALHRDSALTTVMKAVTLLGGTVFVTVTLALVTVVVYVRTRSPRWPAFLMATLVGSIALDNVVKFLVRRPPPSFHAPINPFGSSFPSGHSVAAAALCGSIAFLLTRSMEWRSAVLVWTAAVFVAVLVAVSRVYLGAHWPTDVIAGLILGAFWTAVTATATRYLADKNVPSS
jgi:membrane protein DedA with SNARE-associated domain/membrane-associated phospholipid phosphatase